ncbi:nuclear transport factor 2 family protein [Sphingomonas sp. MMS24-JH45]
MRRLRAAAELQAGLDMEFGDVARERRRRYHEGSAADPSLGMHGIAVLAGPEMAPPELHRRAPRARTGSWTMPDASDIARFNAEWLAAWTAKDVPALLTFYAEDCVYHDPQTAAGLKGHDQLRAYLEGLFAAMLATTYTPR